MTDILLLFPNLNDLNSCSSLKLPLNGVAWTYFWEVSHCNHSTTWHSEYMIVPSLSWLQKTWFSITLVSSLSKSANMSLNFSNRVIGPILNSKFIPLCSFLYTCNSRSYELLEHKKLDKVIFQQSRPVIKDNTACVVAACQNNILLLWCEIQNHPPYYGVWWAEYC